MSENTQIDNNIYYTIPLREVVFFPKDNVPLFVGRKRSVEAISLASKAKMKLLLVTQKNSDIENPKEKDLYKYGVVAEIVHMVKIPPEGSLKIVVQCEKIVKIKEIIKEKNCIKSLVETISLKAIEDVEKAKTSVKLLQEQLANYVSLLPAHSNYLHEEIITKLNTHTQINELCNAIASNLNFTLSEKQQVLEEECEELKVQLIYELLSSYIAVLKLENDLKNKIQTQIEQSQKNYYLNEQLKIINKELNEGVDGDDDDVNKLKEKVLKLKLHKESEEKILSEVKKLKSLHLASAETSVIRGYIDFIIGLPWKKYSTSKIDLKQASKILNNNHHGLEIVKERILEFIAVHQRIKTSNGSIICLVGPPGVGKTSLVESIAKAIGKKFASISLGGLKDESEIRGHRRTYIGAMAGRIIQTIKRTEVSNPLILLDEVDKISAVSYKGDPSFALIDVLDSVQNKKFIDNYVEIPFDLSKVTFILTANDIRNIPYPLLDRMEIINISGYSTEEKTQIAKKNLISKAIKETGLKQDEITISESAIIKTIEHYTMESGVRKLKREIEKICRKSLVNILKTTKNKIYITETNLHKYLGTPKYNVSYKLAKPYIGVSTGLAYTQVGGCLLPIEVVKTKGTGQITFTGSLGDVIKESIEASYKYILSNIKSFKASENLCKEIDLHVHFPEGAIPKDGPSAGIAIIVAIVSIITNRKVSNDFAMTGEMNLRGEVTAIGGLKEKILAAIREDINNVLIPKENMKDLDELSKNTRKYLEKTINIIPITTVQDALDYVLLPADKPRSKIQKNIKETEINKVKV